MTAPVDAKAIAAGLTKAQRACVLAIDVTHNRPWWWRRRCKTPPSAPALESAIRAGLVEKMAEDFAMLYRLTPLGLAVRAYLTQAQPR